MVIVDSSSASLSNEVLVQTSQHESTIDGLEKNKMRRRWLWHGKKEQGDYKKGHDDDEGCKNKVFVIQDDIMQEIFLRLPIKSLHRLKYLSKLSSSLISFPSFLPKYLVTRNISTSPLMLGFFYQYIFKKNTIDNPAIRFIPCSSEAKKFMMKEDNHDQDASLAVGVPPFDESLSFLLKGEDYPDYYCEGYGTFPMVVTIVASSNGFLLCRKERAIFMEYDKYCVCNPITKQWVSLPEPPNLRWPCLVEGFTCEGNNNTYPCLDWVNYKVFRVLRPEPGMLSCYLAVEIFSSETGEWLQLELSTGPSGQAVKLAWPPIFGKSLISKKGTVCSAASCKEGEQYDECAVAFNLNHLHIDPQLQVIPLPNPGCATTHNILDVSEGLIKFVQYENKTLEIYELNEDEMKWLLKHRIRMREVLPDHSGRNFDVEALQPLNSALVLLNLRDKKKVLLDMENKSVEMISEFATRKCKHYFFPYYWPCWPPLID